MTTLDERPLHWRWAARRHPAWEQGPAGGGRAAVGSARAMNKEEMKRKVLRKEGRSCKGPQTAEH